MAARFDLTTGKVLPAVALGGMADSYAWDGLQQFHTAGGTLFESGTPAAPVARASFSGTAAALFLHGPHVHVFSGSTILRFDRVAGTPTGSFTAPYDLNSFTWTSAEPFDRMIGHRADGATMKITSVEFRSGSPVFAAAQSLTPTRGNAWRLWPVPGMARFWLSDGTLRAYPGGMVVADAGKELTAACSLTADQHFVANGTALTYVNGNSFSNLPALKKAADELFASGSLLISIAGISSKPTSSVLSLPKLVPGLTLPPRAASVYRSNSHVTTPDGEVVMGSETIAAAGRWSSALGTFRTTIPLPQPSQVAYFSASRRIASISQTAKPAIHFGDFSATPGWIAADYPGTPSFDRYASTGRLFIRDGFHGIASLNPVDGTRVDREGEITSLKAATSYGSSDDRPTFLAFAAEILKRYEVMTQFERYLSVAVPVSPQYGYPPAPSFMRPDPNFVYHATDNSIWLSAPLRPIAEFDSPVLDAAWTGTGKLATMVHGPAGTTVIERRSGSRWLPSSTVVLPGKPLALRGAPAHFIAITEVDSQPVFTVLDVNLNRGNGSERRAAPPHSVQVVSKLGGTVGLEWLPSGAATDAQRIEWRLKTTKGTGTWNAGALLHGHSTSGTLTGLPAGKTCELRVTAIHGGHAAGSAAVSFIQSKSSSGIEGEPYDLQATLVLAEGVRLEWNDRAEGESGFILRRAPWSTRPEWTDIPLPAGAQDHVDTGISPGGRYLYTVTAVDSSGKGITSAPVEVVVPAARALPSGLPGALVKLAVPSHCELVITDHVSLSSESLWLERADQNSDHWIRLRDVVPGQRIIDSTVFPGTVTHYRVAASNANGESHGGQTDTVVVPRFGNTGYDFPIRSGDIVYLPSVHLDRVRRFDLVSRQWLADLQFELRQPAKKFHASGVGVYFADDTFVHRVSPNGGPTGQVMAAAYEIESIWTSGNSLHAACSLPWSGAQVASVPADPRGATFAPIINPITSAPTSVATTASGKRVAGVVAGLSDIVLRLDETGSSSFQQGTLRYSGARNSPRRVHYLEDRNRVLDENGYLYRASDLADAGWVIDPFDDCASLPGGGLLVVRGESLIALDSSYQESARLSIAPKTVAVEVLGDSIHLFRADGDAEGAWAEERLPLAALGLPDVPDVPQLPNHVPEFSFLSSDGAHWSLYAAEKLILKRSSQDGSVLSRIDLTAEVVAYNHAGSFDELCLLLENLNGTREIVRLSCAGPGSEIGRFFVNSRTRSIVRTGTGFTYTNNSGDWWETEPTGTILKTYYEYDEMVKPHWGSAGLVYRSLSQIRVHPYASINISTNSDDSLSPRQMKVSPDGTRVFFFYGNTAAYPALKPLHELAMRPARDATFIGSDLYTIEPEGTTTFELVHREGDTGIPKNRLTIEGDPGSIDALPGGQLVVTWSDPTHGFSVARFDPNLASISGPGSTPQVSHLIRKINGLAGRTLEIPVHAYGPGPLAYRWFRGGHPVTGATGRALAFPSPVPADSGDYRVEVSNAAGSTWSDTVTVTIRDTFSPLFAEGNLLLVSESQVREITPSGQLVRTINVPGTASAPEAGDDWSKSTLGPLKLRQGVLDRHGDLHLLAAKTVSESSRWLFAILTLDAETGEWTTTPLPGEFSWLGYTLHIAGNTARVSKVSIHLQHRIIDEAPQEISDSHGNDHFLGRSALLDEAGRVTSTWPYRARWFRASHPDGLAFNWSGGNNSLEIWNWNTGASTAITLPFGLWEPPKRLGADQLVFLDSAGKLWDSRTDGTGIARRAPFDNVILHDVIIVTDRSATTAAAPEPSSVIRAYMNHYRPTAWSGPRDDDDGDGIINWDEAMAPQRGYHSAWNQPEKIFTWWNYSFRLPWDAYSNTSFGTVEFSTDLMNWSTTAPPGANYQPPSPDGSYPANVNLWPAKATDPAIFFRIVTPPPPEEE